MQKISVEKLAEGILNGAQDKLAMYLPLDMPRKKRLSNRLVGMNVDLNPDIIRLRQVKDGSTPVYVGVLFTEGEDGGEYCTMVLSPRKEFVLRGLKSAQGGAGKKEFYVTTVADVQGWRDDATLSGLRRAVMRWERASGLRWYTLFRRVEEKAASKKKKAEGLLIREFTDRWKRELSHLVREVGVEYTALSVDLPSVLHKNPEDELWVGVILFDKDLVTAEMPLLVVRISGDRGRLRPWLFRYIAGAADEFGAKFERVYMFNALMSDIASWEEERGRFPGLYALTRKFLRQRGRQWGKVFKAAEEVEEAG